MTNKKHPGKPPCFDVDYRGDDSECAKCEDAAECQVLCEGRGGMKDYKDALKKSQEALTFAEKAVLKLIRNRNYLHARIASLEAALRGMLEEAGVAAGYVTDGGIPEEAWDKLSDATTAARAALDAPPPAEGDDVIDPAVQTLWDQIREFRKINALTTEMDKELGVYDEGSRGTSDLTLEAVQTYMIERWPALEPEAKP